MALKDANKLEQSIELALVFVVARVPLQHRQAEKYHEEKGIIVFIFYFMPRLFTGTAAIYRTTSRYFMLAIPLTQILCQL